MLTVYKEMFIQYKEMLKLYKALLSVLSNTLHSTMYWFNCTTKCLSCARECFGFIKTPLIFYSFLLLKITCKKSKSIILLLHRFITTTCIIISINQKSIIKPCALYISLAAFNSRVLPITSLGYCFPKKRILHYKRINLKPGRKNNK